MPRRIRTTDFLSAAEHARDIANICRAAISDPAGEFADLVNVFPPHEVRALLGVTNGQLGLVALASWHLNTSALDALYARQERRAEETLQYRQALARAVSERQTYTSPPPSTQFSNATVVDLVLHYFNLRFAHNLPLAHPRAFRHLFERLEAMARYDPQYRRYSLFTPQVLTYIAQWPAIYQQSVQNHPYHYYCLMAENAPSRLTPEQFADIPNAVTVTQRHYTFECARLMEGLRPRTIARPRRAQSAPPVLASEELATIPQTVVPTPPPPQLPVAPPPPAAEPQQRIIGSVAVRGPVNSSPKAMRTFLESLPSQIRQRVADQARRYPERFRTGYIILDIAAPPIPAMSQQPVSAPPVAPQSISPAVAPPNSRVQQLLEQMRAARDRRGHTGDSETKRRRLDEGPAR
jgi:hypothetical protein